jgi:endonuclease/exonuclease/phosphatase (EEP) superfamily protein YafD
MKARSSLRSRIRPWELITAAGAALCLGSLFGFLGRFWWFFDLFAHFRVQLSLGLLVIASVPAFRHQYKTAALFALLGGLNFGTVLTLYYGRTPMPLEHLRSYRVILMNVNTQSGDPRRVASAIEGLNPDVIVLEEVNHSWMNSLSEPLRRYPHRCAVPREDNFGIALYSKHPLQRGESLQVSEADVPSITADVVLPDGLVTFVATHPLPPAGAERSRLRNDQLAAVARLAKTASFPVVLIGDLNVTPWSSHFERLLAASGLEDSAQGRGVLPTWPTHLPFMLIPLDHCLHSKDIHVVRRALGPRIGSDHFPLVIDFAIIPRSRVLFAPLSEDRDDDYGSGEHQSTRFRNSIDAEDFVQVPDG